MPSFYDNGFSKPFYLSRVTLDQHALQKQKLSQNKTLTKEITKRIKLCDKLLQDRTDKNKKLNSLQRNYRLSLMRKTGKECYDKEFSRRFMKKKKKKKKELIISAEHDAVIL